MEEEEGMDGGEGEVAGQEGSRKAEDEMSEVGRDMGEVGIMWQVGEGNVEDW